MIPGRNLQATRTVYAYIRAAAAVRLVVGVLLTRALACVGLRAARQRWANIGEIGAQGLERLGGAYLKLGQVLSTRVDLLNEEQRLPLRRLCDQVTPMDPQLVATTLHRALGQQARGMLQDIGCVPVAVGSVTHVHRARRCDTGVAVALKVLRPDARTRFTADLATIRAAMRIAAHLPLMASVPTVEASHLLSHAIGGHLDLVAEARHQTRLARALARSQAAVVPRVHPDLSSSDVVVMDWVDGVRIDHPDLDQDIRRKATRSALHALYVMLFETGLVHCDLHPGNLLVTSAGDLVLLDFGYLAEIDSTQRHKFAELFLAMALDDPDGVADVILSTATHIPSRLDPQRLAVDLAPVVHVVSGATADNFSVARFVASLFMVQRRHQITASSGFVMGVLSLVTIEGLLKQLTPELDFQREAIPFIVQPVV